MAHAIAESQPSTMSFTQNGFEQQYLVTFVGPDVNNGSSPQQTGTQVVFDFDDTTETLRRKVRQAVEVAAQEYGFNVQTIQADTLITV